MGFAARLQKCEGVGLWDSTHWRVLLLMCFGVIVTNFANGMVSAMVTIFQATFRLSGAEVGGLISINLAAGAVVSPLITWSVLKPIRIQLMGCGFLFASAFSVLGALAEGYKALAFAQLGIGIGCAFVPVYGPPLLTLVAPASACAKYVGAFFLAAPIGNAIGLLVGGAMVDLDRSVQSWRYNFWIFTSLTGFVGIITFAFGRIIPHHKASVGKNSAPAEHRPFLEQVRIVYQHPLFDLLLTAFALAGFLVAAYGSFLPRFVQSIFHQNVQRAATLVGIVIAPSVLIGIVISSLAADRIVRDLEDPKRRFHRRATFLVGVASCGLPIVGIVWFMPKLPLFLFILALGLILVFCIPSPAIVAAMEILDAPERTHAMGWINFFYSSIGAIPGPLVLGALLDELWDEPRIAFLICGVSVVLIWCCLVVALLLSVFVLSDKWFAVAPHQQHPHPTGELEEIVETIKEKEGLESN